MLQKNNVPTFEEIQRKIGTPLQLTLNEPFMSGFQSGWFNHLLEVNEILWPQIDLLHAAEKHGTYRVLLTYEQVCKLRELLAQTK